MSSEHTYWLIAVPRRTNGEDVFTELNRVTVQDRQNSSGNWKFDTPQLRVGNMDSLVLLTDEVKKAAASVESTLKKISTQYFDLLPKKEGEDQPKVIEVRGTDPDTFLTRFRWDDSRYSRQKPMPDLVTLIKAQVTKMETELRTKTGDYQTLVQKMAHMKQSQSGPLITRDISKEVEGRKLIESEFMTTLFVAVSRQDVKEWQKSYETLSEYVVPRSSVMIVEENDYTLFQVVVFKKDVTAFTTAARARRFTVRNVDKSQSMSDDEVTALNQKIDKSRKVLLRWALTNFGEAFLAWVHLKCIQCFVEAVLRFGLPADFEPMLILPAKGKSSSLEKTLIGLYKYLGHTEEDTVDEEEARQLAAIGSSEKYYPFVFIEIPLDLRK